MFSRKKDVAKISDKAPVFHVRYIGVTETFVANGRGCSYAPVQRLWDNAPDERYLRKVAVHLSQGGITMKDAEKKEELIGDFPIENISFCNVDRAVNERIFSWICRSSDDARLDCHAVLCSTKQKAQTMAVVLSRAFQIAYKDWKSHTRNREIDRTSAALSGHQKSGAGGSRGKEAGHDTGLNRARDSEINSPSESGLTSRSGSGLSSPTGSGGNGLNGHGVGANGGVVGGVSGKTNNKGIPSPVPALRSKKHAVKSVSPTINASRSAASPTGSTPVSPNLTSSLVALSVTSESHRVRDAATSSSQFPSTATQFASSSSMPPASSPNHGHPAMSANYGHPATSSNYARHPSSSSYEYPTTSTRFMSSSILDPDVDDAIDGVENLQAEYDMDSD